MRFEIKEWYSPEAKVQLEVLNALAGQINLRKDLVQRHWVETHDQYYEGARAAYVSLDHVTGELAARLIRSEVMERRAGNR